MVLLWSLTWLPTGFQNSFFEEFLECLGTSLQRDCNVTVSYVVLMIRVASCRRGLDVAMRPDGLGFGWDGNGVCVCNFYVGGVFLKS